jgi:hypothetical protein
MKSLFPKFDISCKRKYCGVLARQCMSSDTTVFRQWFHDYKLIVPHCHNHNTTHGSKCNCMNEIILPRWPPHTLSQNILWYYGNNSDSATYCIQCFMCSSAEPATLFWSWRKLLTDVGVDGFQGVSMEEVKSLNYLFSECFESTWKHQQRNIWRMAAR